MIRRHAREWTQQHRDRNYTGRMKLRSCCVACAFVHIRICVCICACLCNLLVNWPLTMMEEIFYAFLPHKCISYINWFKNLVKHFYGWHIIVSHILGRVFGKQLRDRMRLRAYALVFAFLCIRELFMHIFFVSFIRVLYMYVVYR